MVKIYKLSIAVILLLSLVGCALPNPSKSTDSLLVGGMILESGGVTSPIAGITVNGTHHSGIAITIENLKTGKSYKMTTHSGIFYLLNPEPGDYFIKKLYYKMENSNGWTDIWTTYNANEPFPIQAGKVTNLGSLKWSFTGDSIHSDSDYSTEYGAAIVIDKTPEQVKDLFAEMYPKSLWLKREWINIDLGLIY